MSWYVPPQKLIVTQLCAKPIEECSVKECVFFGDGRSTSLLLHLYHLDTNLQTYSTDRLGHHI